jgi:hypothetical protein
MLAGTLCEEVGLLEDYMMSISQGRDGIFLHQLSRIDPMSKHQPSSHRLNTTTRERTPATTRAASTINPIVMMHLGQRVRGHVASTLRVAYMARAGIT